eukprot:c7113_g1_i1.p1 GENE.c7113_g1_i1~~c7113_g1_i1.p1  ORF type:complete len:633 (+),score=152.50 c7113_g1_i1:34-1899(+)
MQPPTTPHTPQKPGPNSLTTPTTSEKGVFLPQPQNLSFIDPYGFQRSPLAEQKITRMFSESESGFTPGGSRPKERVRLVVEDMQELCNNFMDSDYYSNLKKAFASQEPPFEDVVRESLQSLVGHRHEDRIRDQVRSSLTGYLHRNPRVGFSPLLSSVCALACASTGSDESAFWTLCFVVEHLIPDYYEDVSCGAAIDKQMIETFLPIVSPAFVSHATSLNVDPGSLFALWLFQAFAGVLPSTSTIATWNASVHEGRELLLQVLLSVVHMCESQLLQATDGASVLRILQDEISAVLENDRLMKLAHNEDIIPSQKILEIKRKQLRSDYDRNRSEVMDSRVSSLIQLGMSADELEMCFSELGLLAPHALLTADDLDKTLRDNGVLRADFARLMFETWAAYISDGSTVPIPQLLCSLSLVCGAPPLYRLRMCFDAFDREQRGFLDVTQLKSLFYSPQWRLLLSIDPSSSTPTSPRANPSGQNSESRINISQLISQNLEPLIAANPSTIAGVTFSQFLCFVLSQKHLVVRFTMGFAETPMHLWQPGNLKPRWVPNNEARRCLSCGCRFTLTVRRHHCRKCGHVFCSKCCSHRRAIPELQLTEKVRVCDSCCVDMVRSMSELVEYM